MLDYIFIAAGLALLAWFIYEVCNPAECTDPFCCPRNEYPADGYPCIVCAHGGSYDHMNIEPGGMNYLCDKHLNPLSNRAVVPDRVDVEITIGPEYSVLRVLKEQGAGEQYIKKVTEQLNGPFGRVMP